MIFHLVNRVLNWHERIAGCTFEKRHKRLYRIYYWLFIQGR